ncbi:hypothetical protein ABZP36_029533 [Zizania latifolia]
MIPLLIITVCPGVLYLGNLVGGGRHLCWLPSFSMQAVVQHLELLLAALLCGCLLSGALLAATVLVLLALLAGALLVTLALAAANLRLARALAVHVAIATAVGAAMVVRPKVAALAYRVAWVRATGGPVRGTRAERFAVVA